jgi:hypothetical protein
VTKEIGMDIFNKYYISGGKWCDWRK